MWSNILIDIDRITRLGYASVIGDSVSHGAITDDGFSIISNM